MGKMTIIPAREAKNRFGEMLDAVQRQPVTITKNGRPVAILTAVVDRKRFEEVEDQIWLERALEAEKHGTLGPAASRKFLDTLLKKSHAGTRSRQGSAASIASHAAKARRSNRSKTH